MRATKTISMGLLLALATAGAAGTAEAQWRGQPPPGPPPYGGPRYGGPRYGAFYGMAGCGLGSLIFGPVNSPGAQLLAATTNSTFGSQTFGITSGTSNCVSGGVVALDREQTAFAEANFSDLKRDMATGGGEYLQSFATLVGCDDQTKPAFAKMMQTRYEALLPSERTTPVELVSSVHAQLDADPQLGAGCTGSPARPKT